MFIRILTIGLLLTYATPAQFLARSYALYTNRQTNTVMQMHVDARSPNQLAEHGARTVAPNQQWDELPIPGTSAFRLANRRSGLVLTAETRTSYVRQVKEVNSGLQMWQRESDPYQVGWRIKNLGTGKYLQPWVSPGMRKDLITMPRAHVTAQMWNRSTITAYPSYVIQNRRSGKVLDVPNATMQASYLQQFMPHSFNVPDTNLSTNKNPAQHWQLRHVGNNRFLIISRATGLVVHVPGWSRFEDTGIQQKPLNGYTNQLWVLHSNGYIAGKHYYHLQSVGTGKFLAIENASTQNHARLVQSSLGRIPGASYQWTFVRRR